MNSLTLCHCYNSFLPNRTGDTKNQAPLKWLSADSGPFLAHTGLVLTKQVISDRQQLCQQAEKSEKKKCLPPFPISQGYFTLSGTGNTPQSSSDYSRQVHIRLGHTVISQLQRKTFAPVWQMCMRSSPATPCTYTELWILFNLPCLDIHLHICFFASNLGGRTFRAGTIFLTC